VNGTARLGSVTIDGIPKRGKWPGLVAGCLLTARSGERVRLVSESYVAVRPCLQTTGLGGHRDGFRFRERGLPDNKFPLMETCLHFGNRLLRFTTEGRHSRGP